MITERVLMDMLHHRYTSPRSGNGERWVVAEQVRNRTGFHADRTADFMAQDTWSGAQGGHLEIHGHEVKTNRADWVTEMKDPTKAEAFVPYCHRWWLVVADRAIVKDGELPPTWGLLVAGRGGLRAVVPAAANLPRPMPRPMAVCLLRAVQRTAVRRVTLAHAWAAAQAERPPA